MVGGSFGGVCGCQRWIERVFVFVWRVVDVANGYVPVLRGMQNCALGGMFCRFGF